jgi:hypothetical protein
MYRDTDQFGKHQPVWYVVDPTITEVAPNYYEGGIGSTKAEALTSVAARVETMRARAAKTQQSKPVEAEAVAEPEYDAGAWSDAQAEAPTIWSRFSQQQKGKKPPAWEELDEETKDNFVGAIATAPLDTTPLERAKAIRPTFDAIRTGKPIPQVVAPTKVVIEPEPTPEPTPELAEPAEPAEPAAPPPVAPTPELAEPAAPPPVDAVPPAPPITPPPVDVEPGAAAPEPTPPPARTEPKTPNKWLVKLADRFGMSAPLDTFVKANLGYESLPEALETTSKLELSTSQRAGKERNLQRNFFDFIVDQAANLGLDLGDIGFFLWARSAADRNRLVAELNPQEFPEGGSGLTTARAAEGLQRFKDEGKLPALNQLARKVDELVDFNLEEDIKAGLMSREEAQQLRKAQPFYVPLKGFAKDGDMLTADVDDEADAPTRQAEAMRAIQSAAPTGSVQEFRKAFGRGSMPFHPLFNLFQDSEARVRRRITNTALLPTLRAYKQNPAAFEGILDVYSYNNPKKVRVSRDIPGGRWEPVPGGMEQEYYRNRDKYMMVKENGVPH